jgi:hypothetical protein
MKPSELEKRAGFERGRKMLLAELRSLIKGSE